MVKPTRSVRRTSGFVLVGISDKYLGGWEATEDYFGMVKFSRDGARLL